MATRLTWVNPMKGQRDIVMTEDSAKTKHPHGKRGSDIYLILSTAGPNRDLSRGAREQSLWDEHAAFIDGLVEDGFIMMGGPLEDEGGAVLVVRADDENDVRETMKHDPWYRGGILELTTIKRWTIFIDERA